MTETGVLPLTNCQRIISENHWFFFFFLHWSLVLICLITNLLLGMPPGCSRWGWNIWSKFFWLFTFFSWTCNCESVHLTPCHLRQSMTCQLHLVPCLVVQLLPPDQHLCVVFLSLSQLTLVSGSLCGSWPTHVCGSTFGSTTADLLTRDPILDAAAELTPALINGQVNSGSTPAVDGSADTSYVSGWADSCPVSDLAAANSTLKPVRVFVWSQWSIWHQLHQPDVQTPAPLVKLAVWFSSAPSVAPPSPCPS